MITRIPSSLLLRLLCAIVIPACEGGLEERDSGAGLSPDGGAGLDAGPLFDAGPELDGAVAPDGGCGPDLERIALVASPGDGHPAALYVPVDREGQAGLLHLDSASYVTVVFLDSAATWVDDAAELRIGCSTRRVPGIGGLGTLDDVEGRPVIGMGGADLLNAAPSLLDIEQGELTWWPDALPLAAVAVPHELVSGLFLLDATLDGEPVTLLLDTGAGHTLWLGVEPLPGDVEVVTQDSLGNELHLWQSSGELGLGGASRSVVVLRAREFPVLEGLAEQLGRTIDGLVGLSALSAIHADTARGELDVWLASP